MHRLETADADKETKIKRQAVYYKGKPYHSMVELKGLEPSTSSMPWMRSPK